MNTVTHINKVAGSNTPMTVLRIQTKAPRKHDISGHLRTCEVESAAINAIAGLEDARRTVAATRLAYERLPRIGSLIGERAWSFHVSAAEVEALSRAERLLGVGYPEAEQGGRTAGCAPVRAVRRRGRVRPVRSGALAGAPDQHRAVRHLG